MRRVTLVMVLMLGCAAGAPAASPPTKGAEPSTDATRSAAPTVTSANSAADLCASERTTLAMESCVAERLRQLEAEIQGALLRFTKVLVARGVADATSLTAASQADWERYRNSHCGLFEKLSEGGSLARVAVAYCRRDLAEGRLTDLRSLERAVVE